jgi:restriction endonuclease Mrr
MQLFLLTQVQELAKAKWRSPEPYIVSLIEFSAEQLAWFLEDLDRLKQLPPDKFQYLIADRLEKMGLGVQLVGDVFRRDGGVDIIAYPNGGTCTFPFLLAVQAKHHRTTRKTGAPDVRDFYGAITSRGSPFHMGVMITNTAFTADATWFAANNQTLLRLRDLRDLRRWLNNDFANEHEWREVPDEIELAPGVRIAIPKTRILNPGG